MILSHSVLLIVKSLLCSIAEWIYYLVAAREICVLHEGLKLFRLCGCVVPVVVVGIIMFTSKCGIINVCSALKDYAGS